MRIILLVTLLLLGSILKAQDPAFTQPMSAFTQLNPALMGRDERSTAFITHRNQWPKLAGNYVTTLAGYYHYASKLNAYWGGDILRDNAADGTIITSKISLGYAQNIRIGSINLRAALKAEYVQKAVDFSRLTFGDMIDQQLGFVNTTIETQILTSQFLNLIA